MIDGITPGRNFRPSHDAHYLTRLRSVRCDRTGSDFAGNLQDTWDAADIFRPDRVSIHGSVVEWGDVFSGNNILGENRVQRSC
jgi:hypothetical protein